MNFLTSLDYKSFCQTIQQRLVTERSFRHAVDEFMNLNFDFSFIDKIPKIALYFRAYDDAVKTMSDIKKNKLPDDIDGTSFLYVKNNNENERKFKIIFEYIKRDVYIAICKQKPFQGQEEYLQQYGIDDNIKLTLLISTYLRMKGCIFVCYNKRTINGREYLKYIFLNNEISNLKQVFKISKNFRTTFFW